MNFPRAAHSNCERRGGALVELAVVLSVLALLLVGVADFGRIAYSAMAVTGSARAGAMFGAQNGQMTNFSGMRAAAESAATDIGAVVDSATRSCECETGGSTTVMTNCNPPGTPLCAGVVRYRVRMMVKKDFALLRSFPLLPATVQIRRVAIMRAQ
jgi:hypothetical protein